ncbi:PAS domain S-box protein [Methanobacterium oryzae]|uniref:PAS domain S-box protein n=1 Tax=Methanobacterium oryzae TaxID=69540 RepID=UPI003D200EE5
MPTKILIVEDEAITAMDIQKALESRGFEVVSIASMGKEAVQKTGELKPDLVLMDIILKGNTDGITIADKIMTLFDIPVIYITAFSDEETFKRAKLTKPYGFITKPINYNELGGSIEIALYKHSIDKKLKENEVRYRSLYENSFDAILMTKPDGSILSANPAACQMFNMTEKELKETGHEGIVVKESYLSHFLNEGTEEDKSSTEIIFRQKDGSHFIGEVTSSFFTDVDGTVKTSMIIRDVSERKKIEEELRQAHSYLEEKVEERTAELQNALNEVSDLYNNAPCGYHSLDKNGYFVQINDTELNWLQYSREEIVKGKKMIDLITDESIETFKKYFSLLKECGEIYGLELDMVKKDGSILPILLNATALTDPSGKFVMSRSTLFDITERKENEKQLTNLLADLRRSNDELRQFAYVSSHDLQEPLRTIASFTQLLEMRYKGKFDSDADEFIVYIVDAAKRMKQQIQDLLEYSRVETQGNEFIEVDSNYILNQAINNLRNSIDENNAIITYDPLPYVIADSDQLMRVFQNLVGNSIKYRKTDEDPKIHISALEDLENSEYVFSVQDNGIGIEKEYFDRIFRIFQRLHTRVKYQGTGIGLSVVKKVIERHNGQVWVESEYGVGSTFYFSLPFNSNKKIKLSNMNQDKNGFFEKGS